MVTKVTVIVPVYNGAESVGSCLDNLIKQTLKEIEIVCVNDGSTDNSLDVIGDYIEKDKRIKVVSQKNGGLSAARNTGIENTKTPFVMFCDCDDIFALDMCEKMVEAIEQNETDVAACGTEVEYEAHVEISDSDTNYYRLKFAGKNYINDEVTAKTDVSVCDKIFRMDLIKKYGIRFPKKLNNEDYYFYNAYMSVAQTIFFVNRKMYKYIRREGSIMSENFEANKYSPDHLLVAKKLFAFYKKNGFLKMHTDLFWNQFSESFWFSYEHSAKKYRKDIEKLAKRFIEVNYDKYEPMTPRVKRLVYMIRYSDLLHKIWRALKGKIARVYRKVNIAYKQQDYINRNIDKIEQETYVLTEKLENLIGRIKDEDK